MSWEGPVPIQDELRGSRQSRANLASTIAAMSACANAAAASAAMIRNWRLSASTSQGTGGLGLGAGGVPDAPGAPGAPAAPCPAGMPSTPGASGHILEGDAPHDVPGPQPPEPRRAEVTLRELRETTSRRTREVQAVPEQVVVACVMEGTRECQLAPPVGSDSQSSESDSSVEASDAKPAMELDSLRLGLEELERLLMHEKRSGRNVAQGLASLSLVQRGLVALERCAL